MFLGTKETFYNYETRGNTSAHSGERWDTLSKIPLNIPDTSYTEYDFGATEEIDRSDVKVKDILRVKPKTKESSDTSKTKTSIEIPPSSKQSSSTTKSPDHVIGYPAAKLENQKDGKRYNYMFIQQNLHFILRERRV